MIEIKNNYFIKKYLVLILLSIHFLVNLFIYLNTNTFREISESASVFDTYNSLISGENFLPISGAFFLTPAFIAFFIHDLFGGGLFYYFIFQIILSTLTVYIVYKIILLTTKSQKQGIIGALLTTLYIEYNLLASVFYNQIYEIFFLSIFLLTLISINDEKKISKIITYTLLILVILYFSFFFRMTMMFIFLVFLFLLLFNFKHITNLLKFSILAILALIISFVYNPSKMFNSIDAVYNPGDVLFWGHTWYGGHGGEVGFVFPENESRFNERLKQYTAANKIDTITPDVLNKFRLSEFKEFIINEPHKWLLLQIKKVFYTFGSVPQKDGLLMLYKGKIKMPWVLSALIIQLPFAIIFIMFLLTIDLNYKYIIQNSYKRILYFIGLYLIFLISIAGPYQERYRPVVFVCFFIPIIAMNFSKIKSIIYRENRRELILKLAMILIFFGVWIYQAYEAIFIYQDRYFKALE